MELLDLNGCKLNIAADAAELVKQLAKRVIELSLEAVKESGRFTIALSGGSTPAALYGLLSEPGYKERLPWNETQIFWGDERCVPHDSPDSNYHMVEQKLLSKVSIPRQNIHPTVGQDENPQRSADLYQASIRNVFDDTEGEIPSFDLILLGLGPEGHTASIFPDSPVLQEKVRLVMSVYVDKVKMNRLTFTLPLINNARHVFFLVEGAGKKEIVAKVLESTEKSLPAQFIEPGPGRLEWYLDQTAASLLKRQ